MRARDVGLVALGACLGAGLAWAFLGRDGDAVPDGDASGETRALRERVAALERTLVERPAPLAVAPRRAEPRGPTPAPDAADPTDGGSGATRTPRGEASAPTPDGEAGARPAAPTETPGTVSLDTVFPRVLRFADGRLVPSPADDAEAAPTPDAGDVRRLLDSGSDDDLVRAASALARSRDRSFLADLVERVNRPEHRDVAPRVIPTIASLKDRPWSALQATGAPDTPVDGDHGTAWASKRPEMGRVSLELTYDRAVRVDAVRIHETLAPGAVAKVEALAPDGTWETLWEGTSLVRPSPSWFEPPVASTRYAVNRLRVTLDTDRVAGWNEIDAVELHGDGLRQWATGASATSSYPDP